MTENRIKKVIYRMKLPVSFSSNKYISLEYVNEADVQFVNVLKWGSVIFSLFSEKFIDLNKVFYIRHTKLRCDSND